MNKVIKLIYSSVLLLSMSQSYALDSVIELTAQGEVNVAPDMAIINFSVESTANTAQAAGQKNAELSENVISYLKKTLPEKNAVITGQYNLSPVYEFDQTAKKSKLMGYQVNNQIQVKTKDLKSLGNLIDESVKLGVSRVDSLIFKNSNETQLANEVLRQAILNGKQQAALIAETAGVKLGQLISVQPVMASIPQPMYKSLAFAARMEAAPSTPIETGDLMLTSQVNMTFRIE